MRQKLAQQSNVARVPSPRSRDGWLSAALTRRASGPRLRGPRAAPVRPAPARVNAGRRSCLAAVKSNARVTPLVVARLGCARRLRAPEHQPRAGSPVAGTRPTAPAEGRHTLSRGLSSQDPRISGAPRLFPGAGPVRAAKASA